jgi:diguanylate cyclase (GGDEF)-like protein
LAHSREPGEFVTASVEREGGTRGVLLLCVGVAAVAGTLWWIAVGTGSAPPLVVGVHPLIVLALVVLAELCIVHVFFRRETHSISLRAIPLVLGLFVLTPPALLVTCTLGVAAVLVIKARLAPLKLLFNVVMVMFEVTLALTVFGLVRGGEDVRDPRAWAAAVLAAVVVDVVCGALVSTAIWLHQGTFDLDSAGWLVLGGAVAAATNATFALVAVLLISIAPEAALLLAGIGVTLFAAYRSFATLRQRHSELEVLQEYTAALNRGLTFDEVAVSALREACAHLDAAGADLWFLPAQHHLLGTRITLETDDSAIIDREFVVPVTDPLWGRLVSGVTSVVVSRNTRDERERTLLRELNAQDLVAAPLRSERGLVGIILLHDRLGDIASFSQADGRLLSALGRYTSVALENGRLIDAVRQESIRREHDALHDQLTGLPNRRHFLEHGDRTLVAQNGTTSAVLLLDLDDFKEVNDTFGHASGDSVLTDVAARLCDEAPEGAMVARLGGDEFAVLLPAVTSAQRVVDCAAQLRQALQRPQVANGVPLFLDASIGVALHPDHGPDVATLLRCADVAMYQAKEHRTSISMYDPAQDNHTPERMSLAADLRTAIAEGSFALGFQPIKSLRDDRVIGVEVLARWDHPTRGVLPPPVYIAVAEQSDLIRLLTGYVLERALVQRRQWAERGLDLRVSVNVSVHDLNRDGFAEQVSQLLAATETPRGQLVIELTETQALHHPERIAPVLAELRRAGAVIAIDDFGTGYSSLTSLRSLPVDEIKIDKSFVSNMRDSEHDRAIVSSLVELANRLGLETVAEGVEDEATELLLRETGCQNIQGYVLTPALPAEELERWMARESSPRGDGGVVLELRHA